MGLLVMLLPKFIKNISKAANPLILLTKDINPFMVRVHASALLPLTYHLPHHVF